MIKRRRIRCIAVLSGLILMAQMAFPAYAEFPAGEAGNQIEETVSSGTEKNTGWDLSKAGTLTVNAGYVSTGTDRTPIEGAEFTVYQVATVTVDSGNVSYVAVGTCKDYENLMNTGVTTDNCSELAAALAADDTLSEQWKIGTQESGSDGNAVFDSVMPGMYLVVQTNTVNGYQAIRPFLVCIPMPSEDGNRWEYHIQALPKLEKIRSPGGGSSGGSSSSGSGGGSLSGSPPDAGSPSGDLHEITTDSLLFPFLPQTGLRRSIVGFLIISGILFITLGWRLSASKH